MIFNDFPMVLPWFSIMFQWFSMVSHDFQRFSPDSQWFFYVRSMFFSFPQRNFFGFQLFAMIWKTIDFSKMFSMHCQWIFDDASKIFWDFPKMFNDFSMMFHWCFNDISESFQESLQDAYGTLTGPEAINPFSNLNILAVKL